MKTPMRAFRQCESSVRHDGAQPGCAQSHHPQTVEGLCLEARLSPSAFRNGASSAASALRIAFGKRMARLTTRPPASTGRRSNSPRPLCAAPRCRCLSLRCTKIPLIFASCWQLTRSTTRGEREISGLPCGRRCKLGRSLEQSSILCWRNSVGGPTSRLPLRRALYFTVCWRSSQPLRP